MITDAHNLDARFNHVLTHTVCLQILCAVVVTRKMVHIHQKDMLTEAQ